MWWKRGTDLVSRKNAVFRIVKHRFSKQLYPPDITREMRTKIHVLCCPLWGPVNVRQKIGSVPRTGFLLMDAFYDISYNWFRYSKCFILFVFRLSRNFLYIRNFIHDSLMVQTEENRTNNLGKMKKVLLFESIRLHLILKATSHGSSYCRLWLDVHRFVHLPCPFALRFPPLSANVLDIFSRVFY